MKRLLMTMTTLPAMAALATVTVGVTATAAAAPPAATAQSEARTAQAQPTRAMRVLDRYCVYRIQAADGLNLRSQPRSSSTALRWMPNGAIVTGDCITTNGGSYTACGGGSTVWTKVSYSGATGWGASRCVRFLYYAYD